jgi:hypothetical protein
LVSEKDVLSVITIVDKIGIGDDDISIGYATGDVSHELYALKG